LKAGFSAGKMIEVTMHRTTDEKLKVIRFFLLEENRKRVALYIFMMPPIMAVFFVKLYLKVPVSMMERFSAKASFQHTNDTDKPYVKSEH